MLPKRTRVFLSSSRRWGSSTANFHTSSKSLLSSYFFTSCSSFYNSTSSIWRSRSTYFVSTRWGEATSCSHGKILLKSLNRSVNSCSRASRKVVKNAVGLSSRYISSLSIRDVAVRIGNSCTAEDDFVAELAPFDGQKKQLLFLPCSDWFRVFVWISTSTGNAREVRNLL